MSLNFASAHGLFARWSGKISCCRRFQTDLTSDHPDSESLARSLFVTTQWTQVLEARGQSPEAKAALSDLCAAYYAPVFAFVRRNTPDEDSTRELTQEFFARILSGKGIEAVDP